ncbi:MAG: PqqD family protein [Candidatus Eremiobacteraeota bacterium]|nr:PqqD family protein [Candidatus Eremiobacteraeota bacterium]
MKTSPIPYRPNAFAGAAQPDSFVFCPTSGQTFSLNETAAFLLQRLRQGVEPAEMAVELVAEFEVEPHQAQVDVYEFLLQAGQLGLGGLQ